MIIVWDEPKRRSNWDKHQGLDFADLTPEFFAAAKVRPAKQGRWQALGYLKGRPLSVIFARYGQEAVSIISMRVADQDERKLL